MLYSSGFDARARWVADRRSVAATVVADADELDLDEIVLADDPGRCGVLAHVRPCGLPARRISMIAILNNLVTNHGYWIVALVIGMENLGVPLPGDRLGRIIGGLPRTW